MDIACRGTGVFGQMLLIDPEKFEEAELFPTRNVVKRNRFLSASPSFDHLGYAERRVGNVKRYVPSLGLVCQP
jgi:hypothetical protein